MDEKELHKMDQRIVELQAKLSTVQSDCQAKESRMYILHACIHRARDQLTSIVIK